MPYIFFYFEENDSQNVAFLLQIDVIKLLRVLSKMVVLKLKGLNKKKIIFPSSKAKKLREAIIFPKLLILFFSPNKR